MAIAKSIIETRICIIRLVTFLIHRLPNNVTTGKMVNATKVLPLGIGIYLLTIYFGHPGAPLSGHCIPLPLDDADWSGPGYYSGDACAMGDTHHSSHIFISLGSFLGQAGEAARSDCNAT